MKIMIPAGRGSGNGNQNPQVDPQVDHQVDTPVAPETTKTVAEQVKIFVSSICLSAFVYWVSYSLLSRYGVSVLLSHLVGYALGLIFLSFLDSIFVSKLSMSKPVFILMTLILLFFLAINFLPSNPEQQVEKTIVLSTESGTINKEGGVWFPDKIFEPGTEVSIEIEHQPVQILGERIYMPGKYKIPVQGRGKIIFKGLVTAPCTIKVSY